MVEVVGWIGVAVCVTLLPRRSADESTGRASRMVLAMDRASLDSAMQAETS